MPGWQTIGKHFAYDGLTSNGGNCALVAPAAIVCGKRFGRVVPPPPNRLFERVRLSGTVKLSMVDKTYAHAANFALNRSSPATGYAPLDRLPSRGVQDDFRGEASK